MIACSCDMHARSLHRLRSWGVIIANPNQRSVEEWDENDKGKYPIGEHIVSSSSYSVRIRPSFAALDTLDRPRRLTWPPYGQKSSSSG